MRIEIGDVVTAKGDSFIGVVIDTFEQQEGDLTYDVASVEILEDPCQEGYEIGSTVDVLLNRCELAD